MSRAGHHDNTPILLVLVAIIAVVIVIELIVYGTNNFVSPRNLSNILMQVAITGIFALSMNLVMVSGGIDLSVGWMMSFLGAGFASLIRHVGLSEPIVVVIVILAAVGLQLLMGYIISRTKLEPFIISLGFMSIYRGFTYLITNGREITIIGRFEFLGSKVFTIGEGLEYSQQFALRVPVILFVLLIFIVWLVVKYTKFGRRVYAVGGNENAAYLAGINVKNFKLLIYGINGLFISLASMTLLSRLGTGSPIMGMGKEIDVIAAVVVGGTALAGGKGNVWGTVIGVVLLGIMSNALNILGVSPHFQYIMKGLLIIGAVLIGYYSSLRTVKKAKKKA
ncbi:MAG: ABC transporter permease [Clostridia bacterium]|nr:ABC transporter permease [Clostridia bacterium]